jgi:hypothetical protein
MPADVAANLRSTQHSNIQGVNSSVSTVHQTEDGSNRAHGQTIAVCMGGCLLYTNPIPRDAKLAAKDA